MATDPQPSVPPWSRIDALHGGLLAAAAVAYAIYLGTVGATGLPPQGDAASHAVAAVGMQDRFGYGWSQAAQSLIYAGSSYPPLLYALSAVLFAGPSSAATLPRAMHAVLIGALLLGWVLARMRWGRAPAWIWVFLQALSPYIVGYASHYMLDLPLAAAVGVGFVALIYARSFDRIGPGLLFGVVAAAGMLFKWTWLLFLGPPFGLCVLAALWRAGPTVRARLPGIAMLVLATGGLLGAGWWAVHYGPGPMSPHSPLTRGHLQVWVGCQVAALAFLTLGWRVRALRSVGGLLAACAGALAMAGPWYLLAQRELWARYAHESNVHASRSEPLSAYVAMNADVARSFFPFVEVLLIGALLLLPFAHRRVRGDAALGVIGIGAGFCAVTATLPFDPRYLLPLLPLAAGVIAAAASVLPRPARWGAAAVLLAGGLAILRPQGTPENGESVQAEIRQRDSNPDVTWTVSLFGFAVEVVRVPPTLDFGGFYDALEAIRVECRSNCDVILQSREDFWIQGRTFEAAGRLAGITGAEWAPPPRPDDPRRPSAARAAGGRSYLLVIQPCSRHGQERSNPVAWRSEVEQLVGAHAQPIGTYPLPLGCEMYVDRLAFE